MELVAGRASHKAFVYDTALTGRRHPRGERTGGSVNTPTVTGRPIYVIGIEMASADPPCHPGTAAVTFPPAPEALRVSILSPLAAEGVAADT